MRLVVEPETGEGDVMVEWRIRSVTRVGRLALGLALLAPAMLAPALGAQEREEQTDCRCVGPDGQEIGNCVCLRTPELRMPGMAFFRAARARIGVSLSEDPSGARVESVLDGSPAEEAGIREGDVITRLDGQSLKEPLPDREQERTVPEDEPFVGRLMVLARAWEPGQEVTVEVMRGDETLSFSVDAEENPATFGVLSGRNGFRTFGLGPGAWSFQGPGGRALVLADSLRGLRFRFDSLPGLGIFRGDSLGLARLDPCFGSASGWMRLGGDCVDGVRLVDVNAGLGEYFGSSTGALVADVSDASSLGLRPGDVILSIGGREVNDAEDARRILSSYSDEETVNLRIVRHQERMDISGTRR